MSSRSFVLRSAFAFATLVALGPTIPAADNFVKIKVDQNVAYAKVGDKELQLDIAYPDGKGPYPAVLCIHGGAWRFGNRQELERTIGRIAERGYVAATVSYRLLPDGKFPDAIVDCKTAIRFLRVNAATYHVDKDRIGALGFSAGAYLACMLGVAGKDAGFEGKKFTDQSSKVCAVVSYFGPTDLALFAKDESAQNSTFKPLLGACFEEDPGIYRKASPINYVTKNAPPFLLLHGTKDWIVPIEHSRNMCKKLKEAGASAQIVEVAGGSHGWGRDDSQKTWAAVFKFLEDHLKK
jgi:acetyl esterase/lipase